MEAAVHNGFRKLLEPGGIPELGPGPRPDVLGEDAVLAALNLLLQEAGLPTRRAEVVRGLFLLWHDHLDAAHVIAQGIEDADGSFLHAIVHRREPDYSNSDYWFRRTGEHGAFARLTEAASVFLKDQGADSLAPKVLARERWNPSAFVELCEEAGRKPTSDPQVKLLRTLQALETECFLEHLLRGAH